MSKLNLLYSCKKIKKSLMRGSKDQVVPELSESGQQNSPLGYFDTIPLELKFTVFSFMSALELSYLTITSKSLRNIVELYRKSERGLQNLLKYPLKHSHELPVEEAKYLKQFKHIGLLLKRSTCLYSTKDRLVLALTFLHKFQCNFQKDCVSVSNCIALTCYGVILHTFTAGWDDRECIRTFETVCQSSYMSQFLDFIIKKKAGALPELEMHVRFFFRRVFLNNMFTKAEKSFWLNLILKPFPIVHQARILYLLFGPSSKVGIQWHEVCESTPPNKEQTLLCFGNIANALLLLNSHCSEWSDDTTLSVLDELFSYPEEWLSENIASLLFLCGENLTLKILVSKAINGRIPELAYIISSLCLVCLKQGQTLSWVVNIVTGICMTMENTGSRRNFLHAVVDMFREVITDVHEFNMNLDDDSSRDLHNLLNAQTAFMKELIEMAYKNMLTN